MLFMSGQHTNKTKPKHFRMTLNVLKTAMSTSCMIWIKNTTDGYLRVWYDLDTRFPPLQLRIAPHHIDMVSLKTDLPFLFLKYSVVWVLLKTVSKW